MLTHQLNRANFSRHCSQKELLYPCLAVLSIAVALAPAAAYGARVEAVPDSFLSSNPHRQAPLWIAISKATTPFGALRDDVVAPAEAHRFRLDEQRVAEQRAKTKQTATASSDICDITFRDPYDDAANMHPSLAWADVLSEAGRGRVFSGRVSGSRIGLYAGVPFTMLAVDVLRSTDTHFPHRVYLLYPSGSAKINGVSLCMSDPRYQPVPEVEDRIVFVGNHGIDSDDSVYRVPPERMFIERSVGLALPLRVFTDAAAAPFSSFDAIEKALLSAQSPTPRPRQNTRGN